MIRHWMPLFIVLLSALIGLLLEYASRGITRVAAKRVWKTSEAIFSSLQGSIIVYALALGVYIASDMSGSLKGKIIEEHAALALCVIAATIMASHLATQCMEVVGRRHSETFLSASLYVSVVRGIVVAVGVLCLLQSLHISTTPILTVLATGGVVLALPLQSTVANLFGGMQIIAARQLRIGDYIKIDDGCEGFVTDVTWRTSTIRDLSDNFIIIPNSKLASVVFTNYSEPEQRMTVSAEALIAYREDFEKVERIALEVARSVLVDLRVKNEEPYARFEHLSEAGITMTTYFAIPRFTERFMARSLFFKRFCTRCSAEGVFFSCQPWAEKSNDRSAAERVLNS
jgi:small-conductance mechanosensitive channel